LISSYRVGNPGEFKPRVVCQSVEIHILVVELSINHVLNWTIAKLARGATLAFLQQSIDCYRIHHRQTRLDFENARAEEWVVN
jgi:hypothetical protein